MILTQSAFYFICVEIQRKQMAESDQMEQPLPTIEHFSAIKRDDAGPDMILPKDPALVHTPPPRVPTGIIKDQQNSSGKKDLTW